jgi:hypothetical protein
MKILCERGKAPMRTKTRYCLVDRPLPQQVLAGLEFD